MRRVRPEVFERARPLLGTLVSIRVAGLTAPRAHSAIARGFAEIERLHSLMSFHERSSDVSALNRKAAVRAVAVSPATYEVIRHSLELSAASRGVFDITIAAKLVDWGLLPKANLHRKTDARASWRDIELLDEHRIRFHRPLWIDLGGIAKGYAVDCAMVAMDLPAHIPCCINAGGDLRVTGPDSISVGLRVARSGDGAAPALKLTNCSVASSSSRGLQLRVKNAIAGPHVHGIRRTAVGARSFVSVIAARCMDADALTKVVLANARGCAAVLEKYGATALWHTAPGGWRIAGANPAKELAAWLEHVAKRSGIPRGRVIREQLEKARNGGGKQSFMRLAGAIRAAPDLSARKGFSRR
jgi:FAD:protein FMN transferase